MIQIKNCNAEIKNGAYIIEYCPSGNSYGKRITVVCYDVKATLKKYKDAGYYLFGSPKRYTNGFFMALRKDMKPKTRRKKEIVIQNAMYFINKAAEDNSITFEV